MAKVLWVFGLVRFLRLPAHLLSVAGALLITLTLEEDLERFSDRRDREHARDLGDVMVAAGLVIHILSLMANAVRSLAKKG